LAYPPNDDLLKNTDVSPQENSASSQEKQVENSSVDSPKQSSPELHQEQQAQKEIHLPTAWAWVIFAIFAFIIGSTITISAQRRLIQVQKASMFFQGIDKAGDNLPAQVKQAIVKNKDRLTKIQNRIPTLINTLTTIWIIGLVITLPGTAAFLILAIRGFILRSRITKKMLLDKGPPSESEENENATKDVIPGSEESNQGSSG